MANSNTNSTKQIPENHGFIPKQYVGVGGIILSNQQITYNEGRYTATIVVHNTGDRPIQVGSHFHFFEVNRQLEFDRALAYGYHLDIPSGTSVRFEPGEEKEVQLTAMGGANRIYGLNDLTCAQASEATKATAIQLATVKGFM